MMGTHLSRYLHQSDEPTGLNHLFFQSFNLCLFSDLKIIRSVLTGTELHIHFGRIPLIFHLYSFLYHYSSDDKDIAMISQRACAKSKSPRWKPVQQYHQFSTYWHLL